MKKLFIAILALTSLSTWALDCKMYEGKILEEVNSRYTVELKLEKSLSCAGSCLYIENDLISGQLYTSKKSATLFVKTSGGLGLESSVDLVKGKVDSIKQGIEADGVDLSVVCTDL